MPREDQHFKKAECNEKFANSLDLSDPTEENWALIAAFYSALHYVESYFARFGVYCGNHEKREIEFKRDPRIRSSYASYRYLQALSHTARYKVVGLPPNPYGQAKAHLATVKKQIDLALNNPGT